MLFVINSQRKGLEILTTIENEENKCESSIDHAYIDRETRFSYNLLALSAGVQFRMNAEKIIAIVADDMSTYALETGENLPIMAENPNHFLLLCISSIHRTHSRKILSLIAIFILSSSWIVPWKSIEKKKIQWLRLKHRVENKVSHQTIKGSLSTTWAWNIHSV